MIRMIPSISADHAKAYFTDALAKSDYYLNDQELQGSFKGKLAERLGLVGAATREIFFALAENIDPKTGKPLTPITRDNRITGYDVNFHCPKSVSVIHSLSDDRHILKAFEGAVNETMRDIEADVKTRIRKNGVYDDRAAGELIYADFVHQTARPVGDHAPDPHLHAHCFVFNATWDDQEQRIKAGKFRDIKRDMPYYQARFHKRLADRLIDLGYRIKRTDHSFEIEGIPKQVIAHFSKRTDEIGRVAKEKGITNAKALAELGAKTRSKKQKGLSMAELKTEWRRQINELDKDQDEGDFPIRYAPQVGREGITREDCIHHAVLHEFERASVIEERRLLEAAFKHAIGQTNISIDDLPAALARDIRIIRIKRGGQTLCTTKEVLREEQRMVALARQGMGKMEPLYPFIRGLDKNDQQQQAIAEVLTTSNQVSIIRGAAGSGKTTLMTKAIRMIQDADKKVTVVAPTAKAARGVLRDEGFKDAETVAQLLIDTDLQNDLKDGVLWVDEAGLLGTKDMVSLLEIATAKNARLILGGDTRQHSAVVRGDALRILNTVADIPTAEVNVIRRQKNAQYKAAVEDLAKGSVGSAFEKLDAMGVIKTVDPMNPNAELVNRYVDVVKAGKSALVVSPTHAQGDSVTADIRQKLRQAGLIGKKGAMRIRYTNLNLTEAEKMDRRNFEPGQVIQFNQHVKGMKRGSVWTISSVDDLDVHLVDNRGEKEILPRDRPKDYDLFRQSEIELAKGDKVRITRNGYDTESKRLDNGMALEVVSVNRITGNIKLRHANGKTDYILDKNFGHLAHDYCVTSHASQGKTVDEVFIAQPASTFAATNAKQFYVSVSRGRDAVHIFTDDREALLLSAQELGERQSALELVNAKDEHTSFILQKHRKKEMHLQDKEVDKLFANYRTDIDLTYEPHI